MPGRPGDSVYDFESQSNPINDGSTVQTSQFYPGMTETQIALGKYVMQRTEDLTGLETSAVRRAIPPGDRERSRGLTDRERSSFFVQLNDQIADGEAYVLQNGTESAFPPAQQIGIMLPPFPGQPSYMSGILTVATAEQRTASNSLRRHWTEHDTSAWPDQATRFSLAHQMSYLLGVDEPSLAQYRGHLDMLRSEFNVQNPDLDRPGEPDEFHATMTLPQVYRDLLKRTHQLVCVDPAEQ